MPGPKEKAAFGARRRIRASVLTGVGVSVQAPIWACLRARYHLLRGRYYRPVADDAEASGCKDAFDQLLFPRVPLRYALPWRS